MAVIIEVLGWGGKSQRHYRAEGPSITIGRGYQNDVVLGDSHISANHLRLDAVEGGWQLNDLQSLNGVEVIKNPSADSTASTMVLADGAEIKIGRTKLRIIADSSSSRGGQRAASTGKRCWPAKSLFDLAAAISVSAGH